MYEQLYKFLLGYFFLCSEKQHSSLNGPFVLDQKRQNPIRHHSFLSFPFHLARKGPGIEGGLSFAEDLGLECEVTATLA